MADGLDQDERWRSRPQSTAPAMASERPLAGEREVYRARRFDGIAPPIPPLGNPMTAAQYRNALAQLGLTPTAAARLLGIDGRTSRRYSIRGVSGAPEILLKLLLTRRISAGDVSHAIVEGAAARIIGRRSARSRQEVEAHQSIEGTGREGAVRAAARPARRGATATWAGGAPRAASGRRLWLTKAPRG
jgi:hypothetical protein